MFQFQFGRERVCIYIHSWRVASALSLKIPSAHCERPYFRNFQTSFSPAPFNGISCRRSKRIPDTRRNDFFLLFKIKGWWLLRWLGNERARHSLSPDGRGVRRRFLNIHWWCAPAPGWANADKLLIIHRPYAIPFHAGTYPKGCAPPRDECVCAGGRVKEPKASRPDDKKSLERIHALTQLSQSRMRREKQFEMTCICSAQMEKLRTGESELMPHALWNRLWKKRWISFETFCAEPNFLNV